MDAVGIISNCSISKAYCKDSSEILYIKNIWSSHCDAVETNPTGNHEVACSIPGLPQRCCRELWCPLKSWLGSHVAVAVAVAVAGSGSSDLTPSLGTSICCRCGPKKAKKKKKFPCI